jgi:ferredoxin-NADP reductase
MPGEIEGTVLASHRETPSTWTIVLSLTKRFTYFPGQYAQLVLPVDNDKRGPSRPLSINSSPTEVGRLQFTTRLSGSPFKAKFVALHTGDKVALHAPMGRFMFDESLPGPFILLAGGIGVTALRSMVRFAVDRRLKQEVFLMACGRDPREMLFRWELEPMAAAHPRLNVTYKATRSADDSSWKGPRGRIDESDIQGLTPSWQQAQYYFCGGSGFVDSMRAILTVLAVPQELQHFEKFTGYP